MSEYQKLRSAQDNVLKAVRKAIDESYEYSQKQGKSISHGRVASQLAVADFFNTVVIEPRISALIVSISALPIPSTTDGISIGELLRNAKTQREAKKWIEKTEKYLLSKLSNESDFLVVSELSAEIDYLKQIYYCFELISILIKKSKRIQRKKDGYFLEYCALCWRLVNKNKILNYDESADYSAYYCLEHHPKKADWEYHRARLALLKAIENSDHVSYEELIERKKDKLVTPLFLYKATAKFASKPSEMVLECFHVEDLWKDRVGRIIEVSESYYPNASEAIKSISVARLTKWREWFYSVISSLDPSGKDASNWDDSCGDWIGESDDKLSQSQYFGERVVLNILHRYEAVCNINNIPRPRGPKKGAVNKKDGLRSEITSLANIQIEKNNKINASEIGKELNMSRQRISVILKELGLR